MAKPRAVIIGAGALGLGFLAERMAGDYELCLADLPSREPLLGRLSADQGYAVNVCRPDGIEVRRVWGSINSAAIANATGPGALARALEEADLVLTAVGSRALPEVVRVIAPILNARLRPVWVLFCENGLNIAARLGGGFTAPVALLDTVMSRMCRFAEPQEKIYAPMWPGGEQRLVVESCACIPLDRARCGDGPFTSIFTLVESADFRMWEDIKLFMHNGLHAFMAYHAFLEGTKRFPDVSAVIRAEALRVLDEELVPAIMFHHPQAVRGKVATYGRELLCRFVNPFFSDSIERGVRGAEEKLAPGERLQGGRDYIREAGREPRGYAATIDAARRVMERSGL
jgi:mannitol-1-phosphate 5-dehydrogenase